MNFAESKSKCQQKIIPVTQFYPLKPIDTSRYAGTGGHVTAEHGFEVVFVAFWLHWVILPRHVSPAGHLNAQND